MRAERLGEEIGLGNLMIKDESRNPTGSFLDRGSTVLVSAALARGVRECGCVTTGNLGASLAAYCAKAGINVHVRISSGVDQGKLYQMLAYGASVDMASRRRQGGHTLEVTPGNPFLLEGEKTTGFEIIQELGWEAPDLIVVPVGTGGHISMIWQSLTELREAGLFEGSGPRLVGVKLEVPPGRDFQLAELTESEPFFRDLATEAIEESRGFTLTTTPGETIAATGLLAKTEGIFAEPSAASVVAALLKVVGEGRIDRSDKVACVITGAGLKDTKSVSRLARVTRRTPTGVPYALRSPQIGETKVVILRLLQRRPTYAYDLWRLLRPELGISTASIYQHLSELEELAMIRKQGSVVSGGRERIVYELTRRGADFLRITDRFEVADLRPGR